MTDKPTPTVHVRKVTTTTITHTLTAEHIRQAFGLPRGTRLWVSAHRWCSGDDIDLSENPVLAEHEETTFEESD